MTRQIALANYFSPQNIEKTFDDYCRSKSDRFSGKIDIQIGADGITWQDFRKNLHRDAVNISNRVLEGSYLFYPMREIVKQKPTGGERILSIACIRDVLVQKQLYAALYDAAEELFDLPRLDKVSLAYRRGKSAPLAARLIWKSYKQGYHFAFDADIKSFFDTLQHKRLERVIDEWIDINSIAGTLLRRFIHSARVPYKSYPHNRIEMEHYFMGDKSVLGT